MISDSIDAGESPVNFALFPSGTCLFCCPVNLDRDIVYQLYTRYKPL